MGSVRLEWGASMKGTATLTVTDAAGVSRPPIGIDTDAAFRECETRGDLKAAAVRAAKLLGGVGFDYDGERIRAGRITVSDGCDSVSLNLWKPARSD